MGLAYAVITNSHPFRLPLNQTTIANELKKGGYSTHAVGKWDLGMFKSAWGYTPTYRGFDTFYGYYSAGEDCYTHSVGKGTQRGIDFRNDTEPVTDKKGYYDISAIVPSYLLKLCKKLLRSMAVTKHLFSSMLLIKQSMSHWKLHRNILISVNQFRMKIVAYFVGC